MTDIYHGATKNMEMHGEKNALLGVALWSP